MGATLDAAPSPTASGVDGALPTGVVTFLFTDIEGSTRLMERHGDGYRTALLRHHALLHAAVREQSGTVFETVGDAVYAAFARPSCAVAAALGAQRRLAAEPWDTLGGDALRVRMGLHTGEVELWGDHYFGPALYRADRLASLGHGGQILLSSPTADLVRDALPTGATLIDLGEHRLKDLQRPERVYQLTGAAASAGGTAHSTAFPPLRTLQSRPNNLPPQATPFIGREREVDEVRHRLLRNPDVRLVTLLGPGGTGKTRLALQVASDSLDDFPDGVYLVALARVAAPELVLSAVAHALGVRETVDQPLLQSVIAHLREKRLLLVLDNFEHVIAAAPRVADLLDACPHLKVLVTSREALRLYGERDYPVPPLSLPDARDAHALPSLGRVAAYEAVRLFVERAQEVSPAFALTDENAGAVVAVCRRLDGLPLAIELAAARTRLLSPAAMLERLDRSLPLLTGGARNLPPRQQTLRGAIAWSYDLLAPDEQALLRRLSVFLNGCSLEAAEATCPDLPVLDGIESLIAKSLLRQQHEETWEEGPRFFMLQTIREFAREQLDSCAETDQTLDRLLAYFAGLAERGRPGLRGARQTEWLDRFDRERYNLREALRWCLARPEDRHTTELGLRLAGGVWLFWHIRGYLAEGWDWLSSLLRLPHAQDRTAPRAFALTGLGVLTWYQGYQAAARSQLEESVAILRDVGHPRGLASALAWLGHVLQQTESSAARTLLEESLDIARGLDDAGLQARALNILGEICRREGDYECAAGYYEESLALARASGNRRRVATALHNLGHIAHRSGDAAGAAARFRETLPIAQALGDQHAIALCLAGLGAIAAARDRGDAAATLFGACGALLERLHATFDPADQEEYVRGLARTRELLSDGAYDAAFAAGRGLALEDAIAYALRV
ncbi:MAG TPA: tetratricopeptide repeat protein [Chloroflexota bacterium]|nr:tetratricopeptide repeat protein [Chloroflexota bacterium]